MHPKTARRKGALTETLMVEYLRGEWALPFVERRHLNGAKDQGDVSGWPYVVCEIKSGAHIDIAGWLHELHAETKHAKASTGFVAVRPKGKPDPEDWYAVLPLPWLLQIMREAGHIPEPPA